MLHLFRRQRAITRIGIRPPEARPGRAGLALVLIVRNEERHIGEWARFHALAGVSRFLVYDNGCTDGTLAELDRAVPGLATVVPWDQKFTDAGTGTEIHNQVLAYAHATRNFGGAFRWLSYLDVDEFLVPVTAASLPEALQPLEGAASISLPWHMFGRNGHAAVPAGGVLENYTRRNPDPMSEAKGLRNFKMIVDPCRVTALKVHTVWTDGSSDTVNDRGQPATAAGRERPGFYSADRIQLNHYYTRSDAELRAKIARGPNLSTPDADHLRRVMRKVGHIEAGEIADTRAPDYLARIGAPSSLAGSGR